MYLNYDWTCTYLESPPPLEECAAILNETGLETEVENGGFEIEHTVNRPDAMSHYGIARELAVKLGTTLVEPPTDPIEISPLEGWTIKSDDVNECWRYMALRIDGVAATPSPTWLRQRLESIDQSCHNVLVDLTNFLLWEFGHPSHAFDLHKIEGQTIRIRYGKDERLTTLDGRQHNANNLLCIADAVKPIAFAGVMGGENSEVDADTRSLLLELAVFRGATARRTGRERNINSDARHRFERGVDQEQMMRVIRRFIFLLRQEQPNIRVTGLADMNHRPFKRKCVHVRRSRLDKLLGVHLDDVLVLETLKRMNCQPEVNTEGWRVSIPGYKVDVSREVDVIEEIIRFAGFKHLQSALPAMGGSNYRYLPARERERKMRTFAVALGLQETCTYSFLAEEWYKDFQPQSDPCRLRNPMTEKQAVMRGRILPNLLDCVRRNLNRGVGDLRFFEMGHVFEDGKEPHHLAVVMAERRDEATWWAKPSVHPFYEIKGVFQQLCQCFGWQALTTGEHDITFFSKGESLGIYLDKRCLGGFGLLSPALLKKWDIDSNITALELNLDFLDDMDLVVPEVKALPNHPGMRIDMAFVLDSRHTFGQIVDHLQACKIPHLEKLSLFDVYEGKAVGSGKKSLGFRFDFRATDRSLTSEETAAAMDQVVQSVKEKFGAIVRE